MRSLLRFVLLCLMAVALPLQGFAATGALHCATMHERMQAGVSHHHDDVADHHEHHDHDRQAHERHGASPANSATEAGADDGAGRLGGLSKCSACAACCVGIGLPAGAITLPAGPAESVAAGLVTRSVAPFLTSGPERPPRVLLA